MGRRATGTVEPLKSAIRLKFTHKGTRCVETLNLAPTPANIRAAQRHLASVMQAIGAGSYRREDFFAGTGPSSQTTFSDYADEWLKTVVVEKSTMKSFRSALKATWKPAFGDKLLGQIRYSDIKRAIAERVKPLTDDEEAAKAEGQPVRVVVSGKTINNAMIVLRDIFDTAVKDGLIAANPTVGILNLKHQAAEPDPFTRDEMEGILAYMRERHHEQVANWYEFAFVTGLRPSEQIVLRWSKIDWARSKARIDTARVQNAEKGTKTNRVREIDLSARALDVLQSQRAYTFMKGPNAEVFENPNTNRAWWDEGVQRQSYFIPTLRALGLRHRDAYHTRHTFATLLLMGGVNPTWIAKQLGHANTGMLFKVYGRWIEGADRGAEANKADTLLSQSSSNCPRKDEAH